MFYSMGDEVLAPLGPLLDDAWFTRHRVTVSGRHVLNLGEPVDTSRLRALGALASG